MKRASCSPSRAIASAAWLIAAFAAVVACPSSTEASASWKCPGYPEICQETCSLDPYDVPIYCEGGVCVCGPGFDTTSTANGIECDPQQPDFMPSSSDEVDCSQNCTSTVWGIAGGISNAFDLVAVHGTSPGGEPFMPVWGYQQNFCGVHGAAQTDDSGNPIVDAEGHQVRSWGKTASGTKCTPDPFPFCDGVQDSDEADFNPTSCDACEGCGSNSCGANTCVSAFTNAWPYLDTSDQCQAAAPVLCPLFGLLCGEHDPSRIDFPNNVSVYRAPINWENHSDEGADDDYTWDMHSPGSELYDTNTNGRVHVEFDADETIDHMIPNFDSDKCFNCVGGSNDGGNCDLSEGNDDCPGGGTCSPTPNPPEGDSLGLANLWWRKLRCLVDQSPGNDDQTDNDIRCFMKQIATPSLECPLANHANPNDLNPPLPDPMGVVVGAPSIDCADNPHAGTDELHPAYAMAIRIQTATPNQPEQWAFFYRRHGDNGGCGTKIYGRCGTSFKLPLGLPLVPDNKVLTSADVEVDAHPWAEDDTSPSNVVVEHTFDLLKGTVLNITLPDIKDGTIGIVSITPNFDTTPPTITCPTNITTTVDLGKCTASPTFGPTIGDNCLVSAVCSPSSGSAFPIGTTTDTCTATDQAGNQTSCSFDVTITAGNKCPLGVGYWKKHPDLWAVSSLMLGTVTYDKTQLLSILDNPTTGDASVILAKAEIGALLSLANGSNPTPICGVIADANDALGGSNVPANVSPKTTLGQRMISDGSTLNSYELGTLTPGCTP